MSGSSLGTADTSAAMGSAPVSLRSDGPCLTGTLRALPLGAEAREKVRRDAVHLASRIIGVYAREIASGEVGANGTATAGAGRPVKACTGLLYGRIQSGKTVAMIGLVAAAIDNGFRVVVVLTSDNVKLVSQTAERFRALDGPIVVDALGTGWSTDHTHIGKHLGRSGVVFVCSKNRKRLDDLIEFLNRIGAPNHPALILDDEADQATLDTNLAKSSRARRKGLPAHDPTAIHARVAEELSQILRHHVFVQVTATPYALLLQSVGSKLRPSFNCLLEPGAGYTGGEYFFEAEHIEEPKPPLVYVASDESSSIEADVSDEPSGLRDAIAFFLVAAAAQWIGDPERARFGQNFLCHTSRLREQHRVLERMVRSYVDRIDEHLDSGRGEALDRIHRAHEELRKTHSGAPSEAAIVEEIRRRLVGRKILVVNAEDNAEMGRGLNLVIGGNILGRGVTIENLLVTYYLREPKVGQMDTMLQHARMYGYRENIMHLTRVFLPEQLAVRFHEIHCIERRLRRQLAAADMERPIVIETSRTMNVTRPAVLDPTYLDAFDAEDQIFPIYPDFEIGRVEYERIAARVQSLIGSSLQRGPQREPIRYDDLIELIETFPYDRAQGSSRWIPSVLRGVVEKQKERCQGRAYLYTRRMERKTRVLATGALDGSAGGELEALRNLDGPVFCAFRDDGDKIPGLGSGSRFWYPTLVLDKETPSLIVNVSSDDL